MGEELGTSLSKKEIFLRPPRWEINRREKQKENVLPPSLRDERSSYLLANLADLVFLYVVVVVIEFARLRDGYFVKSTHDGILWALTCLLLENPQHRFGSGGGFFGFASSAILDQLLVLKMPSGRLVGDSLVMGAVKGLWTLKQKQT